MALFLAYPPPPAVHATYPYVGATAQLPKINLYSFAPIKHRRVVLFDYDDTLFPTSAWTSNGKLKACATLPALRKVGKAIYELLKIYIRVFGEKNVRVVTNGSQSWVLESLRLCSTRYSELSSDNVNYWAAIYNSFISLDILVSSARDMHCDDFPQHAESWKIRAFKNIVKRHFNLFSSSDNNVYSMVSIGDSEDEYVASFEAKRMLETQNKLNRSNNIVRLHRVKLKKHPRIEDILSQIAMLMVEAKALFNADQPITIRCDPAPTDIGV